MTITGTPACGRPMTQVLDSSAGVRWAVRSGSGGVPESWSYLAGSGVAATVPGEVHADLLLAGVIPDLFDAGHEALLTWIGHVSWVYTAEFDWTPNAHDRTDLAFDGLDTYATVRLNGAVVATVANQHRSYRFPVKNLLNAGANRLEVEFAAPVPAAGEAERRYGARPHSYALPFNAVRKMASNFGWDWGVTVTSSGIWKSVSLQSWSGVRISSIRPLATLDGDDGRLDAHVCLEWAGAADAATVHLRAGGAEAGAEVPAGTAQVLLTARLPGVDPWWPRGYGDPVLYDMVVEVISRGSTTRWKGRVGFRSVGLDIRPDKPGTSFGFVINGEAVFIRGANWIPGDALTTRMTPERYRTRINDAIEANVNMLRVWGGGIYEDEAFYAHCDQSGVLVWQDFLFACAAYSEDRPLRDEVEAEAREAITRLSQHPSLAVWNGGNENIWGYVDWGWREVLGEMTWGRGYYFDLLPRLVAELDPRTPYTPSSPFSFGEFLHPNDKGSGTSHIWDVWNTADYSVYHDYAPRFVAEFGFQGPPAWSTLSAVVHDEPLTPHGREMLVHQKAVDGNGKLERGLGEHLPQPRSIEDWHWTMQLNQARAVGSGIEHFRSLFPLNRGAIVWQLNDNWPVISWAAVDYAGIRKPLWFVLRRVFADRLLTVQRRRDHLCLFAHNDGPDAWQEVVRVARRALTEGGEVIASLDVDMRVDPRSIAEIPLHAAISDTAGGALAYISAVAGAASAFFYFEEDPRLGLQPQSGALDVYVTRSASGVEVTVRANALVKDVTVLADRVDPTATVDSGMVTLEAGDEHVFSVSTTSHDLDAFRSGLVMRSSNQLIAGG